ncbi:DUF423 domain-containing protein [Persicobacter psychrovividus]|uniref:DUF423 domain-containing protein n=2 Tax=Persicobacter psychrovividus TaxID=387638 RepID=A0ABM7VC04_9BACT|nr:DUF423 domain-containing protein [Persicobacter psychrovividus]
MIATGAILGGLAVMIGAFGAHALKDLLEATGRAATFETGVKYQMYHAILIILLGVVAPKLTGNLINYSFYAALVGILLFSGSLYALCLTNTPKLGIITPFGGVAFIVAWACLAIAAMGKWSV